MYARPMVATKCFDTYWRFATERQRIYYARLSQPVGPWTTDPVLSAHRFTNAYRASDRVSQYLIKEVQYNSVYSQAPDEVFFRTMLFKLFNSVSTWELLTRQLGPLAWQGFNLAKAESVMDEAFANKVTLYSAAYIMQMYQSSVVDVSTPIIYDCWPK